MLLNLKNQDNECWNTKGRDCCCQCIHHYEVFNHCYFSSENTSGGCICDQSLNIWICKPPIDGADVIISAKHSIECELFERKI